MDDYSFLMAQRTFDVHGYAVNPSIQNAATPIVGSLANAYQNGYNSIENIRPTRSERKETKRKRGGKGDASVVDGEGAYMGPWANWQQDKQEAPVIEEEEDDEEWREEKRRREEASAAAKEKMKTAMEEKSIFHGTYICASGSSYHAD